MISRRLAAVPVAVALLLAGCSSSSTPSSDAETGAPAAADASSLLRDFGLDGMDTREVIDHLDRLGGDERPTNLIASIRTDEVVLSDGTRETTLPMPADELYVSMAPYVDQTHDCFFHSLTTCQGELVDADVDILVRDDQGEVVLEETTTTYANGFVGVWLPRDLTGTVVLTVDGRSVEAPLSTTADSATCLTGLQLA
ncbi:CueP family metal-binding protein [Sanguibacter inulinus]|uniref:CueP family metal-binding protein n=1 Tax=Sanguibacter inulinus TaxID=60922 RepID=A0A853ESQ9_9MICO|nr:CueP family metal-binding protein [Sanguibacter inulinus]MBF0722386.1 CueP family metal-binding protein [Sanguibacter inulinus]NYS93531.1 CueP family metal-binding protein [Sanguibacter inulinus]